MRTVLTVLFCSLVALSVLGQRLDSYDLENRDFSWFPPDDFSFATIDTFELLTWTAEKDFPDSVRYRLEMVQLVDSGYLDFSRRRTAPLIFQKVISEREYDQLRADSVLRASVLNKLADQGLGLFSQDLKTDSINEFIRMDDSLRLRSFVFSEGRLLKDFFIIELLSERALPGQKQNSSIYSPIFGWVYNSEQKKWFEDRGSANNASDYVESGPVNYRLEKRGKILVLQTKTATFRYRLISKKDGIYRFVKL